MRNAHKPHVSPHMFFIACVFFCTVTDSDVRILHMLTYCYISDRICTKSSSKLYVSLSIDTRRLKVCEQQKVKNMHSFWRHKYLDCSLETNVFTCSICSFSLLRVYIKCKAKGLLHLHLAFYLSHTLPFSILSESYTSI